MPEVYKNALAQSQPATRLAAPYVNTHSVSVKLLLTIVGLNNLLPAARIPFLHILSNVIEMTMASVLAQKDRSDMGRMM